MNVKFINVFGFPRLLENSRGALATRLAKAVSDIDGVDQQVGDIGTCFIDSAVFTNVSQAAVRTVIDLEIDFSTFRADDSDKMQSISAEISSAVRNELQAFLDDKSYTSAGVLEPEFSAF